MTHEQFIPSADGTQLFVKKFQPAEPAKAQLLILHGYLEHCLRYTEFGEYLAKNHRISVTTYDFRGHGKSGGDRPVIRRWEEYEEDFEAIRVTMEPNLPLFVLGHSNGGLTVLHYFLSHQEVKGIKGVVVTNPYVAATDSVSYLVLLIVHALGSWFPRLKVASNLKAEELMSCPVKQEEHRNDAQVQSYASIGWASHALKAQGNVQKWAESNAFPLPLLYIYSTHDKVAKPETVKVVGEALRSEDKTIICRQGEEHEVLNEVKREETYEAIASWILDRI
jgi:alpha-beta hydrolase superfamily lysophospholipase